jgi:hypothetical protein
MPENVPHADACERGYRHARPPESVLTSPPPVIAPPKRRTSQDILDDINALRDELAAQRHYRDRTAA